MNTAPECPIRPFWTDLWPFLARTLCLVFCALLVLSGCSRIQLAYNTSGLFIEQYADRNLALSDEQLDDWRPILSAARTRHRHQELPYLSTFFDTAWRAARQGFDNQTADCLLEQAEIIYLRHARLATAALAPLLANATPRQVTRLERQFREDFAKDLASSDPREVERSARKRAKRYARSAEWWIGPLVDAQRRIIADVTGRIPDTSGHWNSYRFHKQTGLIERLRGGADEDEVRRFLQDWLVDYRDLPPDLDAISAAIRAGITELLVRLDGSLTAEQRDHFSARLKGLRDDFMALQRDPRMAPISCASI